MPGLVITVAIVVVLVCLVLLTLAVYRASDWHRLRLARKGVRVHLTTDPACWHHVAPPREGSRLWRAAAGYSCPICMDRYTGPDSPW